MLIAVDVETICNVPGCVDPACEHAVDPLRNKITVIGAYWDGGAETFRVDKDLIKFLSGVDKPELVFHGGKFDVRTLAAHGVDVSNEWTDDTHLMAVAYTQKIPKPWLERYEVERKALNSKLPPHKKHREAKRHSLKTLAPYFLGVAPFWEDPTNHDNDEYVLQDCEYTFKLYKFLSAHLHKEGSYDFYKEKLLPWTKTLVEMETAGIRIDMGLLARQEAEAKTRSEELKAKLDAAWADAYHAYGQEQVARLRGHYKGLEKRAVAKLKDPTPDKVAAVGVRYGKLWVAAGLKQGQLNLDSPPQLKWLLRDYFKLDVETFDGEESTGKAVLEKLAAQGRDDIKTFLEYRKARKLSTAFFPSYHDYQVDGVIHANFNPGGTRTGRLSSSAPNLQQVPGHLHPLFVAREGYSLVTRDMAGIEPVVLAYYSQDPTLCQLLLQGRNFHDHNTKIFFSLECDEKEIKKNFPKERALTKELGLAILYGAGWKQVKGSGQKFGFMLSDAECRHMVRRIRETYSDVWNFKEALDEILLTDAVTNIAGRQFRIQESNEIYMKGLNTLVQGSASDLVWNSAYLLNKGMRALRANGGVRLLVHDELVVEVEDERLEVVTRLIEGIMTGYALPTPYGNLPLKVEGGTAKYWSKG